CSGFAGRSRTIGLMPAAVESASARRSTALAGNGLAAAEHVLELAELLGRADPDQHVPRLEHLVRLRRRVEGAVRLAQRDDDRARLVADAQVADRAAG